DRFHRFCKSRSGGRRARRSASALRCSSAAGSGHGPFSTHSYLQYREAEALSSTGRGIPEARHDGRKGGKWGRAAKTAVFLVERRHRMENPLLTQAAALLTAVVRQQVALPCSLEQLEATLHPLAHAVARQAAAQLAAESVAQAEEQPLACACGG